MYGGETCRRGVPLGVEHLERPADEPEPGDAGSQRNAVVDLGGRRARRQVDEVFAARRESPMQDRPPTPKPLG